MSDTAVIDNVTNACNAVEIPCESADYRLVAVTGQGKHLPKIDDAIKETGQITAQQREQVKILTGRQANVRQERQKMISPRLWIRRTLACWLVRMNQSHKRVDCEPFLGIRAGLHTAIISQECVEKKEARRQCPDRVRRSRSCQGSQDRGYAHERKKDQQGRLERL